MNYTVWVNVLKSDISDQQNKYMRERERERERKREREREKERERIFSISMQSLRSGLFVCLQYQISRVNRYRLLFFSFFE